MSRWFAILILTAAVLALGLRIPQLDNRPMHGDEAVNAVKFGSLWEEGEYKYDPNEFHGPVLHYVTLPFAWLSPADDFTELSEVTLRAVPVVFGVGLVLLLLLLGDAIGRVPAVVAGVLTAISPAFVFYSRYFIHEMLLVFFTMLVLVCLWRYSKTRKYGWLLLGGAGVGLMYATKETFVLAVFSMCAAACLVYLWERYVLGRSFDFKKAFNPRHIAGAVLVGLAVIALFFSSFLTNPEGLIDAVRTYIPWLTRAGGESVHVHPWYYYLQVLTYTNRGRGPVWSEALIGLLAIAGIISVFVPRARSEGSSVFLKFLALYSVILATVYSVIPYKTPWCLLGFWNGMILMAGVGACFLFKIMPWKLLKGVVAAGIAAACVQMMYQAWYTNFRYFASPNNPYVYAHSLENVLDLADKVNDVAEQAEAPRQRPIFIIAPGSDYWPLPWYLRDFENIGYWSAVPSNLSAVLERSRRPIIIASSEFDEALQEKLGEDYRMVDFYGLRPSVFMELFVPEQLWQKYLESVADVRR
ncbi:MAG: TIGR03663 family protein [Verrucomicrobia bacterium]|nr:TIGR03663 family protein [Verrucomicrobiota bacterium]